MHDVLATADGEATAGSAAAAAVPKAFGPADGTAADMAGAVAGRMDSWFEPGLPASLGMFYAVLLPSSPTETSARDATALSGMLIAVDALICIISPSIFSPVHFETTTATIHWMMQTVECWQEQTQM